VIEEILDRLAAARRWYLEAVDALGDDKWDKPSLCAGWTAANVVAHVAVGDQYVRALVHDATGQDRSLLAALPKDILERAQRAEAMAAWEPARLRETARRESEDAVKAISELVRRAPETPLRMALGEVPVTRSVTIRSGEYIVHGHDLESATGYRHRVPAWYIDAALHSTVELMPRLHKRSRHKGKTASFHLHRTDGEGEWIVQAEGGEARSTRGHERTDVALRGPAEGLYWVLMGRGRPQDYGVEIHGDTALAAAFKEWFPGP
jgi:uncharacterized protein (TIGR03083 family)